MLRLEVDQFRNAVEILQQLLTIVLQLHLRQLQVEEISAFPSVALLWCISYFAGYRISLLCPDLRLSNVLAGKFFVLLSS